MVYDNFVLKEIIHNDENSIIQLGEDNTCIKKVDLPKCISRLRNEAECLKIMNGNIAPKLIAYSDIEYALRMEYIRGYTLSEYVEAYGEIPKYFYVKLVRNLFELLDNGIEYGAYKKINEHFIIDSDNNVRIIDFGISNIYLDRPDIIGRWKEIYKEEFAFVFTDSEIESINRSKDDVKTDLIRHCGIKEELIDKYFATCDKF